MTTPDINNMLRQQPADCRLGAPMGARNQIEPGQYALYVQRVNFIDGDYAPDGTYWGGRPSPPLYCGFSADGATRVYVRATSRALAAAAILAEHPAFTLLANPAVRSFDFYEDPGHGWCKVPRALLAELKILSLVSRYSYQRGAWVFLEEDGDLGLLYGALRIKGIEPKLRRHVTDKTSRIRGYDGFTLESAT